MQDDISQVKYPENVEDSVPLNLKEVKKKYSYYRVLQCSEWKCEF